MMSKKTGWFDALSQSPFHVGMYEYRYDMSRYIFPVFWDGTKFIIKDKTTWNGIAVMERRNDKFRGLANKPKVK